MAFKPNIGDLDDPNIKDDNTGGPVDYDTLSAVFTFHIDGILEFSCAGCADFRDYLSKVGRAVGADGILTMNSVSTVNHVTNESKKTLRDRYLNHYAEASIPAFAGLSGSDYANNCRGIITLPYSVDDSPLTLILPGTNPQFCSYDSAEKRPMYSFSLFGSLKKGDKTYSWSEFRLYRDQYFLYFCFYDADGNKIEELSNKAAYTTFPDNVVPLRLGVYLQGPGGSGGDSEYFGPVNGNSGGGGGSGALVIGVLNLASLGPENTGSYLKVVPATSGKYATITLHPVEGQSKTICSAGTGDHGKDGEAGGSGGWGGSIYIMDTAYFYTVYINGELKSGYPGKYGGADGENGESFNVSEEFQARISLDTSTISYDTPYYNEEINHAGGTSSDWGTITGANEGGGGAASFYGDGADGSDEKGSAPDGGAYGAGGSGASWESGEYSGGSGAPGLLTFFY